MTVAELQQIEADEGVMENDLSMLAISFISVFVC